MRISDFFLPKIANSDPKIRLKAVGLETNIELLENVAKKDRDEDVRAFARKRIREIEAETA